MRVYIGRRNREKKGKLIRKTELLWRERMEKKGMTLCGGKGEREREENEEVTGAKTKNKTSC